MQNKIKKNFTQVPNDLINDPEISRDARFLFIYLCSKSEDWKFFNSKIEKDLNCSKNTRQKYMRELMEKGWISISQKKTETGEWGSNEIELNITPAGNFKGEAPQTKNTAAVKHGSGKTTPHTNTNLNTNTDLNNIYISPAGKIEETLSEDEFLDIWKRARLHYDKKHTGFKTLSFSEKQGLKDILKDYSKSDIERAIAGLFFQDTLPNVRIRPTHLLDRQYFETYLDCWNNKTKIYSKDKKKKDNTGMI